MISLQADSSGFSDIDFPQSLLNQTTFDTRSRRKQRPRPRTQTLFNATCLSVRNCTKHEEPQSTEDADNAVSVWFSFGDSLVPIYTVRLVGQVNNKHVYKETNCINFELDDGTSTIPARFITSESNQKQYFRSVIESLDNHQFCEIIGTIHRVEEQLPFILVLSVYPVVDFNQITYHQLSCIRECIRMEEYKKDDSNDKSVPTWNHEEMTKVQDWSTPKHAVQSQKEPSSPMASLRLAIQTFMKHNENTHSNLLGVTTKAISEELQIDEEIISDQVLRMADEGMMYMTMNHWKLA